jgi:hypothetical protein
VQGRACPCPDCYTGQNKDWADTGVCPYTLSVGLLGNREDTFFFVGGDTNPMDPNSDEELLLFVIRYQ